MNSMELSDHDGTHKCLILASSPKLEHMNFSLSSFHPVESSVLFVNVLVFIICITFIFVVKSKETNDLTVINFLILAINVISVISFSLVNSLLFSCFHLWVMIKHLELGSESVFVLSSLFLVKCFRFISFSSSLSNCSILT